MQTLSPPDPATITQPHLTAAPGPTSSHSSSTSPAPFHLNATASTSSLRSSPDTELPAADLDGGRPVRAKRAADADSLWDLGDGGGSEGDDRPTTDAQPSSRSAKPGSAAAKGKRKAAGSARVSKGDSEVWGVEVDAALHKAAFELLPRMDRAATVSVDGTLLARNQLIGWYIFRITGEERRRKQVMSRLQVLLSTTSHLKPPDEWAPGGMRQFFGPDYAINLGRDRVHVTSIHADAAKVKSTPHGDYSRHATRSDSSQLPPFRPPASQPSQPRRISPPPPPPSRRELPLAPFRPRPITSIRPALPTFIPSFSYEFTPSGFVAPRRLVSRSSQSNSPQPNASFAGAASTQIVSPRQFNSLHPIASSSRRSRSASEAWSPPAITFEVASSGSPVLLAPLMRRTRSSPLPPITSPALALSTTEQDSPLLVPSAALSCPVTPVALALWLEDGRDGPAHYLTRLGGNGGAGPSGVVYLNENDARFPGVAAMDRQLACQLLHLQLNLALPLHPFPTSEIKARLDLTTAQPYSLASFTTIYSKGHPVAQLPEELHPATVIDPRSSPLRHGYGYYVPFPTRFWTELLRMPLDPRGVASFAKKGANRVELDRRLRGMSMVQEFVVLSPKGGSRATGRTARGSSAGNEKGDVVLVLLYEFECAEAAENGETDLSFVSIGSEGREEPQRRRGASTSLASNGFALPPPR